VAQSVGLESKPQHLKRKKKEETIQTSIAGTKWSTDYLNLECMLGLHAKQKCWLEPR
jgi:hypothetical protein